MGCHPQWPQRPALQVQAQNVEELVAFSQHDTALRRSIKPLNNYKLVEHEPAGLPGLAEAEWRSTTEQHEHQALRGDQSMSPTAAALQPAYISTATSTASRTHHAISEHAVLGLQCAQLLVQRWICVLQDVRNLPQLQPARQGQRVEHDQSGSVLSLRRQAASMRLPTHASVIPCTKWCLLQAWLCPWKMCTA